MSLRQPFHLRSASPTSVYSGSTFGWEELPSPPMTTSLWGFQVTRLPAVPYAPVCPFLTPFVYDKGIQVLILLLTTADQVFPCAAPRAPNLEGDLSFAPPSRNPPLVSSPACPRRPDDSIPSLPTMPLPFVLFAGAVSEAYPGCPHLPMILFSGPRTQNEHANRCGPTHHMHLDSGCSVSCCPCPCNGIRQVCRGGVR